MVGALCQSTLLVEDGDDACAFLLNEIEYFLIIRKVDERPLDALTFIFLLLELEHILVELALKRLVAVINAQLFEGIHSKRFEAKNIQNANCRRRRYRCKTSRLLKRDGSVDLIHNVPKERTVRSHHECFERLGRLITRQDLPQHFTCYLDVRCTKGII